jgi:hypothetical protein
VHLVRDADRSHIIAANPAFRQELSGQENKIFPPELGVLLCPTRERGQNLHLLSGIMPRCHDRVLREVPQGTLYRRTPYVKSDADHVTVLVMEVNGVMCPEVSALGVRLD